MGRERKERVFFMGTNIRPLEEPVFAAPVDLLRRVGEGLSLFAKKFPISGQMVGSSASLVCC